MVFLSSTHRSFLHNRMYTFHASFSFIRIRTKVFIIQLQCIDYKATVPNHTTKKPVARNERKKNCFSHHSCLAGEDMLILMITAQLTTVKCARAPYIHKTIGLLSVWNWNDIAFIKSETKRKQVDAITTFLNIAIKLQRFRLIRLFLIRFNILIVHRDIINGWWYTHWESAVALHVFMQIDL